MWSARLRSHSLQLLDDFPFTKLTLVENYNQPDTCVIEGPLDWLRVAMVPGAGVVVSDETGTQRFSGVLNLAERRGDGTGALPYHGDLVRLRWRICYPDVDQDWDDQAVAYDVQTASAEARALGFIYRNAGLGALTYRRIAHLRLPTSLNRGPSGTSSGRFHNLGDVAAAHCELAGLRIRIVQTYEGTTPYLDVVLTAAPNLSAWARFGTTHESGPGMLGDDWVYRTGIPDATALLAAAGGALENRYLQELNKTAAAEATPWGERIEKLVDQRNSGTDAAEITQALEDAWLESSGIREITASIAAGDLELGTDVPVGAVVAAVADGQPLLERMRRLTTTVTAKENGATVKIVPTFGSPDAALKTPAQRQLTAMLRSVRQFERS